MFEYNSTRDMLIGLSRDDTDVAKFLGACVDTGSHRSVIEKGQAIAYCDFPVFRTDSIQQLSSEYSSLERKGTGVLPHSA